jgi:hypothetical protein
VSRNPVPSPARRRRGLSNLLLLLGLPLLGLGLYGVGVGLLALTWPRTEAVILASHVDVGETASTIPGTDKYRGGRIETRETASFRVRYRYRVGGRDYEAGGVEPADFGLQTSAAERELGRAYQPGQRVMIAYDPRHPERAYLRPGPSSPAQMLAIIGGALALAGLWLAKR